jgi:DNA-binding transcriptional ArsR family regulator
MTEPAVLTAIASPRRREILRLTWDEERQAGDIRRAMPDVSWGAVSLQVRALVGAGLLQARVAGRHRYYRADRQRLAGVADMLERMWSGALATQTGRRLEATRRGPRRRGAPDSNFQKEDFAMTLPHRLDAPS